MIRMSFNDSLLIIEQVFFNSFNIYQVIKNHDQNYTCTGEANTILYQLYIYI